MYEELTEKLRCCVEQIRCGDCRYVKDCNGDRMMMSEAADAIEEAEMNIKHLERDYKELCSYLPKWIPVTKKLPEKDGKFIALAYSEANTMDYYYGHWMYMGTEYTRVVTHWMPLPEPPKEAS